jgi:hypothetical protein
MKFSCLVLAAGTIMLSWAASAWADQELLFVADANGPVAAYSLLSSGPVSPALTLPDPAVPNTYWGPWGVAFDAQQNLYVQSFLSDATSFVYAPGGGASPSRIFRGGGPDSRSIAVDASGYEYVATGEGPSQILVLPPGASGQGTDLYSVSPLRSINTDEAVWHPWPSILATDAANHLMAAIVRTQGNAIEVFDGGAAGGASPIREITGPLTGLGTCADTVCNTMALTFSPASGHLWVGVTAGAQTHVSLFANDASGDFAPLRTIQGSATGLAGKVITGIAESQQTGELFVLAKDAQFGGGQIVVYDSLAQGDAAPSRSFTDVSSPFANAAGIGITNAGAFVGIPPGSHPDVVRLITSPNPTRGTLTARLSLPRPVPALRIQVFDAAGRSVATIWRGDAPAGTLEASWNGRFGDIQAAAGVYLIRASGKGLSEQGRFVLLR